MPKLERKDLTVDGCCAAGPNIAINSRSPSPPTLQHKDMLPVDSDVGNFDVGNSDVGNSDAGNSPTPRFCREDSSNSEDDAEFNEVNERLSCGLCYWATLNIPVD